MRKKLYVDNVDLSTYGIYVSGAGTFGAGEREFTFYDVPGRDGALLSHATRLANVQVSYDCIMFSNFAANIEGLRSFLLSKTGYVQIKDDYHPGEFRLGIFQGPFNPDVVAMNNAGKFTLVFNCRPERWLTTGQTATTLTNAGSTTNFVNPSPFTAKPFIRVYGYGSVTVGDRRIGIDNTGTAYVDIDCETMNAYYGSTNLAAYITTSTTDLSPVYGIDFPTLPAGTTGVYFMGANITKVEFTPRWWVV